MYARTLEILILEIHLMLPKIRFHGATHSVCPPPSAKNAQTSNRPEKQLQSSYARNKNELQPLKKINWKELKITKSIFPNDPVFFRLFSR